MNGDNERTKFRIRTYSETEAADSSIRVELKMRKRDLVIKKNTFISIKDYRHFMQSRHWPADIDPVLIEFERHLHMKQLQPQVVIDYLREGYEMRYPHNLRITFDHKVRSAHSKDLFSSCIFYREHHPFHVIMEIKFTDNLPVWVKNLVHQNGLKLVANSKFTQAIQAARHDLHHPNQVVVIR